MLNQPIVHKWQPIEDLPAGYEAMAGTELRSLSEVWLEQRESLPGFARTSPVQRAAAAAVGH